jgi:hypothetical protein
VKKKEIREQVDKCDASAKKRKTGEMSIYRELVNVLFAWYHQAHHPAFLGMEASCGRNP